MYSVNTLRSTVIFEPTSNMTMQGFGTIKVANGVYAGAQCNAICPVDFFNDVVNNSTLRDFTLDMNGQNNIPTGYTTMVGVGFGKTIVIDNAKFLNMPGSQTICIGDWA